MTWTSPATPISLTPITISFYETNIADNLDHLRGITGGDPGAADKALVSTGATTAAWGTIPDAAIADPKVSKSGDSTITNGLLNLVTSGGSPPAALYYRIIRSASDAATTMGLLLSSSTGAYYWLAHVLANSTNFRIADGGVDTPLEIVHGAGGAFRISRPTVVSVNGSAAAPAVAVGTVGTAGLYSTGTDLRFATNGGSGAMLDNDGRLLLGSSPPAETVSGQWLRVDSRILASAYDLVSDERAKHDVLDLDIDPVAVLRSLDAKRYYRDGESDREELGFMAQGVTAADPRLGHTTSVDLYALLTLTIAALQAAFTRIEALESRA